MAKTKQQKELALTDLSARMKAAKGMVFADIQKLKIKDTDELRQACRDAKIDFVVSKKTILRKALKDAVGLEVDTKSFQGGISAMFGMDDEVAPAQVIANFARTRELVKIFGGVLEGAFIDSAKVKQLSALPSKLQLLGQLVGTLNAPVSGFVNVLAGNLRGLVTVLGAIKDKKPA
ncbi:MAG: 50S ribosomal protein L10 [Patescibacteria group bacterium]